MQYVLKVSIYNPFSNPKITNSNCLKRALDRLGCGPEQVCCGPEQVGRLTSLHRISEMPCCGPEQFGCGPEQVRRKWYCPVAGRNSLVAGRNKSAVVHFFVLISWKSSVLAPLSSKYPITCITNITRAVTRTFGISNPIKSN